MRIFFFFDIIKDLIACDIIAFFLLKIYIIICIHGLYGKMYFTF